MPVPKTPEQADLLELARMELKVVLRDVLPAGIPEAVSERFERHAKALAAHLWVQHQLLHDAWRDLTVALLHPEEP